MRVVLHSFVEKTLHYVADDDVPTLFMLWVIQLSICILMILQVMLEMMMMGDDSRDDRVVDDDSQDDISGDDVPQIMMK